MEFQVAEVAFVYVERREYLREMLLRSINYHNLLIHDPNVEISKLKLSHCVPSDVDHNILVELCNV